MTQAITDAETERFRTIIARRFGLHFEDAKLSLLADVLRRRVNDAGQSPNAYLARLDAATCADEVVGLVPELTVSETYFFRNRDQFRAFAEIAVPDRMNVKGAAKRLTILSAGCASGEETYSIGIVLHDVLDASWEASILGVDLNPEMVQRAARGHYSAWALRETPIDVRERWFTRAGREFILDDALRSAVKFQARNLAEDDPQLWRAGSYDVVFFRNVFMYFTPEQAQAVIARIAGALKPGGYLFLGHAETLRGVSGAFHLQHTHDTFYYQRKDRIEVPERLPPAAGALSFGTAAAVEAVAATDTWIEAIGRATARIEALTGSTRTSPRAAASTARPASAPAWNLDPARTLLREERFAEAHELVERLPPGSERDPDVLLLRAALLTHRGRWGDAETACQRLLEVDELNAGAHYLLALCREGALDRSGARHHDQVAAYLDPGFAMPRLHLGLLARRAGDRAGAQQDLGRALPLLQHEDSSRLLLFGGGFTRDALVALCQAELVGCGGTP